MAEQINQVIDNLCEKLGIAAELLYPLMVKQSYVSGIAAIIWCLISVAVIFSYIKLIRYYFAPLKDNKTRYKKHYDDDTEELVVVLMVFGGALALAAFIILCVCSHTAFNALLNPEWYAIKELLKQVK